MPPGYARWVAQGKAIGGGRNARPGVSDPGLIAAHVNWQFVFRKAAGESHAAERKASPRGVVRQ
jgi:hypothetical protein